MCPTGTALRPKIAECRSELRSAFEVLDVDRDGKISRDDLRTIYGNEGGGGASEEVIEEMITAADANEDGYVEYEEFEGVLGLRSNGVMEEAFRVMDRDGDGRVGHEDLRSYLKWAGFDDASDEDIKAMIKLGLGGGDETHGVTFEGLLKSCIGSPDLLISPSSNTDLSPLLPTVTADNKQKAGDIINHINSTELKNCARIVSVEAEMVVHHLKQAQIRLMSSANSDLQTKKLLDALIGLVIEEFTALPEEKDPFSELVSLKTRVVFTSFFLWILVVCLVLLFSFQVQSSFNEPPPT